jgi:hypothetical protein
LKGRSKLTLRTNDSVANGVADEFGKGRESEFSQQIRPMGFGSSNTDPEHICNFLIALTLSQETDHFTLAIGKVFPCRLCSFAIKEARKNNFRNLACEIRLVF